MQTRVLIIFGQKMLGSHWAVLVRNGLVLAYSVPEKDSTFGSCIIHVNYGLVSSFLVQDC